MEFGANLQQPQKFPKILDKFNNKDNLFIGKRTPVNVPSKPWLTSDLVQEPLRFDKQQQQQQPTNILSVLKTLQGKNPVTSKGKGTFEQPFFQDGNISSVPITQPDAVTHKGQNINLTDSRDASQQLYDYALQLSFSTLGKEITTHLQPVLEKEIFSPYVHDSKDFRDVDFLPWLPPDEINWEDYGSYGGWAHKATTAELWELSDISDESSYVGKAYNSELKTTLMSLQGQQKKITQQNLKKYVQNLKRYGPSCRAHFLNEVRRMAVLHVKLVHAVDDLTYQRNKSNAWRSQYSPDIMTEASTIIQNKPIPDIDEHVKELSIAMTCDILQSQLKDSQDKLQLLVFAAGGVLQEATIDELLALGDVMKIHPTRIQSLLESLHIEGLDNHPLDVSLSPNSNLTMGSKSLATVTTTSASPLVQELNRGTQLRLERIRDDIVLEIDTLVCLDIVHYISDSYDAAILREPPPLLKSQPSHKPLNFASHSALDKAKLLAQVMLIAYSLVVVANNKHDEKHDSALVQGKYKRRDGKSRGDLLTPLIELKVEESIADIKKMSDGLLGELKEIINDHVNNIYRRSIDSNSSELGGKLTAFDEWLIGKANNDERSPQESSEPEDFDYLMMCQIVMKCFIESEETILNDWFRINVIEKDSDSSWLEIKPIDKIKLLVKAMVAKTLDVTLVMSKRSKHKTDDEFPDLSEEKQQGYLLRRNLAAVLLDKYKGWIFELPKSVDDTSKKLLNTLENKISSLNRSLRQTQPDNDTVQSQWQEVWKARGQLLNRFILSLGNNVSFSENILNILPVPLEEDVSKARNFANNREHADSIFESPIKNEEDVEAPTTVVEDPNDTVWGYAKEFFWAMKAKPAALVPGILGAMTGTVSLMVNRMYTSNGTHIQRIANELYSTEEPIDVNNNKGYDIRSREDSSLNCKHTKDTFAQTLIKSSDSNGNDIWLSKPSLFRQSETIQDIQMKYSVGGEVGLKLTYVSAHIEYALKMIETLQNECFNPITPINSGDSSAPTQVTDLVTKAMLQQHLNAIHNHLSETRTEVGKNDTFMHREENEITYVLGVESELSKSNMELHIFLDYFGSLLNGGNSMSHAKSVEKRVSLMNDVGNYRDYLNDTPQPTTKEDKPNPINYTEGAVGEVRVPGGKYIGTHEANIYFRQYRAEKLGNVPLKDNLAGVVTSGLGFTSLLHFANADYGNGVEYCMNAVISRCVLPHTGFKRSELVAGEKTVTFENYTTKKLDCFQNALTLTKNTLNTVYYTPALYGALYVALDTCAGHLDTLATTFGTTTLVAVGTTALALYVGNAWRSGWKNGNNIVSQTTTIASEDTIAREEGTFFSWVVDHGRLIMEPKKCLQTVYLVSQVARILYTGQIDRASAVFLATTLLSFIADEVISVHQDLLFQLQVILNQVLKHNEAKQNEAEQKNILMSNDSTIILPPDGSGLLKDVIESLGVNQTWLATLSTFSKDKIVKKVVGGLHARRLKSIKIDATIFKSDSKANPTDNIESIQKNIESIQKDIVCVKVILEAVSPFLTQASFAIGRADVNSVSAKNPMIPYHELKESYVEAISQGSVAPSVLHLNTIFNNNSNFINFIPHLIEFSTPLLVGKLAVSAGATFSVLQEFGFVRNHIPKCFLLKKQPVSSSAVEFMKSSIKLSNLIEKIEKSQPDHVETNQPKK